MWMGSSYSRNPSKMAATMGIENFSGSSSWIFHFKQCYGLVFKKLVGDSTAVNTNAMDL
jgi:hypothetical protein